MRSCDRCVINRPLGIERPRSRTPGAGWPRRAGSPAGTPSDQSLPCWAVPIFDRFRHKRTIELTPALVAGLLREQHPDLADLPLSFGARGWDNQLWRLGDELAVRLPWQTSSADELILKEHTWLPVLSPRLPLPVPVPQRLGNPSAQYRHPWIVTTWVPGTPADQAPASNGREAADALAAFLNALHHPAPDDAPAGRGRGGPLTTVAKGVSRQLDTMPELCKAVAQTSSTPIPDAEELRSIWNDAMSAPDWSDSEVWLHGDLHPANVLTADAEICGVVDFGDLCAGDPALDVASAWILLPDLDAIDRFRAACPVAADAPTWRRARGWAIWRAQGSLSIATADHAGAKPSWGPPALQSLDLLTASAT